MKKNIAKWAFLAICIFAIVMVIIGAIIMKHRENEMDKHLVELSINELQEKINNKESFILVITQTTCSHCAEYKPTLKKVLYKYDITAYYIEKDLLSDAEKGQLNEIANVSSTPTTIFIKDGEEKSTNQRFTGNRPESEIISKLKYEGYIK